MFAVGSTFSATRSFRSSHGAASQLTLAETGDQGSGPRKPAFSLSDTLRLPITRLGPAQIPAMASNFSAEPEHKLARFPDRTWSPEIRPAAHTCRKTRKFPSGLAAI